MPRVSARFNWGDEVQKLNKDLYIQLTKAYSDIVNVLNTKSSKLILDGADPSANSQTNKNYDIGDLAIRTDNDTAWIMTSRTTDTAVTWTLIT